jgi:hypothetical protein
MPGNAHDGLVAQSKLGEFCDCLMPQVMEPKAV